MLLHISFAFNCQIKSKLIHLIRCEHKKITFTTDASLLQNMLHRCCRRYCIAITKNAVRLFTENAEFLVKVNSQIISKLNHFKLLFTIFPWWRGSIIRPQTSFISPCFIFQIVIIIRIIIFF